MPSRALSSRRSSRACRRWTLFRPTSSRSRRRRRGGIGGFTVMNDWSARDLQRVEMRVGLGPAKGKDFATSLGPVVVTPDEFPYRDGRLHLEAVVRINGPEVTR